MDSPTAHCGQRPLSSGPAETGGEGRIPRRLHHGHEDEPPTHGILDRIRGLPTTPGVYQMKDARGRVIYVGKATSLRTRVRSYFQSSRDLHPRTRVMVSKVTDIEVIATDSPVEALILESSLIKKHRPYFNVKMRDDKRYPMLEMTMGETYPRLRLVRQPLNPRSRYFGPFTNSHALRKTMKVLQRVFRVRTCSLPLDAPLARPCLDYHIQQCTAPCTRLISVEDYRASVVEACQFLEGHTRALVQTLNRQMEEASENLDFERCIRLRNVIRALQQVTEKQKMVSGTDVDEDILGFASREGAACVAVLQVREGSLSGEQNFVLDSEAGDGPARALESFIVQYYAPGTFIPPNVLISHEIEDTDAVGDLLGRLRAESAEGRRTGKVLLRVPQRGRKRELAELACRNAAIHLDEWTRTASVAIEAAQGALDELQEALQLSAPPWRIECFDISNIQGKHPVASMVVFERGRPKKSDYRRFRIRSQDTPDDFRMMREVLTRRLVGREDPRAFPQLPDLLVVDGGKGQLGVAVKVLEEQGLQQVPLAGLAKQEELIFLPGVAEPVRLDERSAALLLLRRVRDESHRFAITYHRQLRGKTVSRSLLDQVPGIGKQRKKDLLKHFGSLGALMDATREEIATVPGLGEILARQVYAHLHAPPPAATPPRDDQQDRDSSGGDVGRDA